MESPLARPAVAVLSLQLTAGDFTQLTPDGVFRSRDGRPRGLPGWRVDPPIAERLLAKLKGRATQMVVDYEHQTLLSEVNGQPAPAAGWIDPAQIEYRPGSGLWAPVRWTQRAKAMIDAGEYAYLSPVLPFDAATGEVTDVAHVALVNYPGLDGMAPVAALSARYRLDPEDPEMDKTKLIALLGLTPETPDDEILAAVAALKARADQAAGLETELATLKAETGRDATRWVPRAVYDEAKAALAALKATASDEELDRLIDSGLSAGKIPGKATAEWLRQQGPAALKLYLAEAPEIAVLKGATQTGGKPPAGTADPAALSPEEQAVLKAAGLSEAAFRKAKAA